MRIISEKMVAILERNGKYAAGVFTPLGLYSTCFPHAKMEDAIKCAGGIGLTQDNNPEYLKVLESVFAAAEGRQFEIDSIDFDFTGYTEKQARILKAAMNIKWGETASYGELAKLAGFPKAARFAGNCMNRNRYAPLVPCHRVVAANGIGGFGGNLDRKKALLLAEGSYERIVRKRFKSYSPRKNGP